MKDAQISRLPKTPVRRLLEETKLGSVSTSSPPLPRRDVCENCRKSLDAADDYQIAVKICRPCLRTFANVGAILERHAAAKIRRTYLEAR